MRKPLLYGGVPIAIVVVGVWIELAVIGDNSPRYLLKGSLNDVIKQAVSLETSLSQLITGLATALIGAAAYYLRSRRKAGVDLALSPTAINRLLCVILVAACASVYFGQLWIAALRDQLIHDYVDFMTGTVQWPERLQSGFFLLGLVWFAELVFLCERTPASPTDARPNQQSSNDVPTD